MPNSQYSLSTLVRSESPGEIGESHSVSGEDVYNEKRGVFPIWDDTIIRDQCIRVVYLFALLVVLFVVVSVSDRSAVCALLVLPRPTHTPGGHTITRFHTFEKTSSSYPKQTVLSCPRVCSHAYYWGSGSWKSWWWRSTTTLTKLMSSTKLSWAGKYFTYERRPRSRSKSTH